MPSAAFVPAMTPSETYTAEPRSGAHTAVEVAVTELTDKEAVTIKRSRGLVIGVGIGLLGAAAIISFILVKLLAVDGEVARDVALVGAADAAAVELADATRPTGEPLEADAAPVVVVDAAARIEDAAVTVTPDAAVATPDAGRTTPIVPDRPQRPKPGKLVIVVSNPTSDTVITINGSRAGNRRAEVTLPFGSVATVVIRAGGRKPQTHYIRVLNQSRTFELKDNLMMPGQK